MFMYFSDIPLLIIMHKIQGQTLGCCECKPHQRSKPSAMTRKDLFVAASCAVSDWVSVTVITCILSCLHYNHQMSKLPIPDHQPGAPKRLSIASIYVPTTGSTAQVEILVNPSQIV